MKRSAQPTGRTLAVEIARNSERFFGLKCHESVEPWIESFCRLNTLGHQTF